MPDLIKDLMSVLIPGALETGATALTNQGKRRKSRTNPLAGFIRGAAPGIQDMIDRSLRTDQQKNELGKQTDLISGMYPESMGKDWISKSLEAGMTPAGIMQEGENADTQMKEYYGGSVYDEALRQGTPEAHVGAAGVAQPKPVGQPPADFWKDISAALPDITPAMFGKQPNIPYRSMSVDDMLAAASRLDPKTTPDEHRKRIMGTKQGQLAEYGDALRAFARSKGQELNPGEYEQLMTNRLAELEGKPTGFSQEQLLGSLGERTAADKNEADYQQKLTRSTAERDTEEARTTKLLVDLGYDPKVAGALAAGVPAQILERKGLIEPLKDTSAREEKTATKEAANKQRAAIKAKYNFDVPENREPFVQDAIARTGTFDEWVNKTIDLNLGLEEGQLQKLITPQKYNEAVVDTTKTLMTAKKAKELGEIDVANPVEPGTDEDALIELYNSKAETNDELTRQVLQRLQMGE